MNRMNRTKLNNEKIDSSDILNIVNEYKEINDEKLRYGKKVSELGDKIKSYMRENNVTSIETDLYKATISERINEDFNEDYAISLLKEKLSSEQLAKVIKTKEYIDDDELEKLTYNKQFNPEVLKPCITYKEPTITLRVSKLK